MFFASRRRWVGLIIMVCCAVLGVGTASAQSNDDIDALRSRVIALRAQGKYAEATSIAERYVEVAHKRYGEERVEFAAAINILGLIYQAQGRHPEAEPLYKRNLAILEKALGPEHPTVGVSLNNLAELYMIEGRAVEAEPLHKRSLAILEKAFGPEHPTVATSLNNLASLLQSQGRYPEAEPLYKRSLAIRWKGLGPAHPDVATSLNNLAALYENQGRNQEAERFYQRSLAIREKAFGPEHPDVATSLNNLAALYASQSRYAEAEPLHKRSLAIREKALGPEHPDVARSLNNLSVLYQSQGRYPEAEPLYKRSLAIWEKVLGPEHALVATSLSNLAVLYDKQGRHPEAEPLYKRSLAIREQALGSEHPDVATSLSGLAELYRIQGLHADAEPLQKRSLAIREKAFGFEHALVADSLNNLAALYASQGRYAEAEPLHKRSLAIREKALGPEHPDVAQSLNNLAELRNIQGHYPEAEPLYKRSLAIWEKALGSEHPDVATSLSNLAALYVGQGRTAEAESILERSLAIREKALGPEHPGVAQSLNSLAVLYDIEGRYSEAEPHYKRSLAIFEKSLGSEHPNVATALSNLAGLFAAKGEWERAAEHWRRSTAITKRRAERGVGGGEAASGKGESSRLRWQFWGLVKVSHRLAGVEGAEPAQQARDMFETAQWAQSSEAAQSLAQMAVRTAKGAGPLAALARERQDLVGEWQVKDKQLIAAKSAAPDVRMPEAEKALAIRLATIDARLAEIDAVFAKDFPDYAALTSPESISIADVQAQLRDDEALVLFLDTPEMKPIPEETFVWVVTKTDSRVVRSELGTSALQERVTALRCGLDYSNWTDASVWGAKDEPARERKAAQIARRDRCRMLTGADVTATDPPPFDAGKAHELYQALFGQVEDLLKSTGGADKHLLVVPSGPLTQLPFHVLVTNKPDSGKERDYANIAWLARRHAITVLPSVASLEALRQHTSSSETVRPTFVGFGNPLLAGPDETDKRAWEKQSCPKDVPKPEAVVVAGGTLPDSVTNLFRGGTTKVAALRRQIPLPETADELCAVARVMGANAADVNLGGQATETRIRQLNADTVLAQARIVHFATHGFIASEIERIARTEAEPALLLTPPETASETDDGLLKASEVAELKLDADWVVLSACNTAAGGEKGNAEALSGLARAFFYAGARALLVSHWYVDSLAAVKIMTGAFTELQRDPAIGRAEALRRSMLAAMSDPDRPESWTPASHPSVWAPFVVVGEGGAGK